jgi:hypothetical protein
MKRYLFAWSLAAAAAAFACVSLSDSGGQRFFVVAPVLDSVFVGDTLPPRAVFLEDGAGNHFDPGPFQWSINPTSVATVDASGKIAGKAKGTAFVVATRPDSVASGALVIVSRRLEMTLLLDTLFLMPNDTITVPLAIAQKTPAATTVRFDSSPTPSVYTIDTTGPTAGRITAHATGGPLRYVAHLTNGTDSIADTGAVVVMSLTDTIADGRFYMTAFGTGIRHQSGGAFALHYPKRNGKLAFRLVDSLTRNAAKDSVLITLRDSILAAGTFEIDSIGPQEATTFIGPLDPYCVPKRPWAVWSSHPTDISVPPILAYSHGTPTDSVAGQLVITQYAPAPAGGGAIISGRYLFRAQRLDLYGDPLGAETIRGTFVVPLRLRNICNF